VFLGANQTWVSRPDIGAAFGSQFAASGFRLVTPPIPAGAWRIVVFAHSTVTGAFSQAIAVPVTVR
jgi:hypothetical protein